MLLLTADPWADFLPALAAGVLSGLSTGVITGLIVGGVLNRGQRKAAEAAMDREYELSWQSIRSSVLRAIRVNDTPDKDDPTQRTASQLRMQVALEGSPVRVWAAHLKSSELSALVDLLNAWDRRELSHAAATSALAVKVISEVAATRQPDIGLSYGMWGLMTSAYNTGFAPADVLWKKVENDPVFMSVVARFRTDYYAVHVTRNALEQALTEPTPSA